MTTLSLAVRNYLALDHELRSLLGKSVSWETWIFDEDPLNVHVENTGKCLIVVRERGTWASPNDHNSMRFPRLLVDIWADPTRNPDRTIRQWDAATKIEQIQARVDSHLHLSDPGTSAGMPYIWGTLEQVVNKTGVVVAGSLRKSGPDISPIRDTEGALMGQLTYGINLP